MELVKLAIIEDDATVRESLESYLSSFSDFELCLSAFSVEKFLEQIIHQPPIVDIILLDIGLPGMTGLEGIRAIYKVLPTANIIMLTTFEEEEIIFKALCAGAVAYLTKRSSLQQIRDAIIIVNRGGSYMSPSVAFKVVNYFSPKTTFVKREHKLTKRQLQVVQGIVDGLSYKMIADKLLLSVDTVQYHIKQIYTILQINSKSELIKKSYGGEL